MPPKSKSDLATPNTASTDQTVANIVFICDVMSTSETEIKPDWKALAVKHGIGHARNVPRKFKTILAKYGYEFENGKMVETGNKSVTPAPTASTKSTSVKRKHVSVSKSAGKNKMTGRSPDSSDEHDEEVELQTKVDSSEEEEDVGDDEMSASDAPSQVQASVSKNKKRKQR